MSLTFNPALTTSQLGVTAARSTAQVDVTSSTTLVAVTGLSVALAAAGVYSLYCHITGTAGASGGAKFAFANGDTLTATSISYTAYNYNAGTINAVTTTTTLGNAVGAATAVITNAVMVGTIVVNAAGTIVVQIAQNASNGTPTSALVNSFLVVTRIA